MQKAFVVSLVLSLSCTPLAGATPRPLASAALLQDDAESEAFSPDQLDNLLAPIALYPDPLLAQVLLAATFVDQVDEAARYVRANGQDGVDDQDWDVAVRAVAHYPVVLDNLADKLDWTTSVGQAYAAQSTDVMASVQRLRQMARSEGNLETTNEQEVLLEDDYIRIVPADPTFLYVPRYSPAVAYYRRPVSGLAITFGVGLAIGAWLNDDFDWRGHRVYYHGWSGGGWIARSRPRIRVTTTYVNPRFSSLSINRRVVDRNVNYGTLNRYNSIHRNVTYDRSRGNRDPRIENRTIDNRTPRGNAVINRNMNTSDPRLDHFRGRDDRARPDTAVRTAPDPPRAARPEPASPPDRHAYGRAEGGFDPGVTSRRGQASREAARRPPEAQRTPARPTSEKATPRSAPDRSRSRKKD